MAKQGLVFRRYLEGDRVVLEVAGPQGNARIRMTAAEARGLIAELDSFATMLDGRRAQGQHDG